MNTVSRLAAYVFVAALAASLHAAAFSAPAEKSEGNDLIRQVNTMAKVLETRLREELGGDVVGPSLFQPGGVRGFVVPDVGAIFQINVNFPVVEPGPPAGQPPKPENEDLWNRMERGEPAGSRVMHGIRRSSTGPPAPPVPGLPHSVPPGSPTAPADTNPLATAPQPVPGGTHPMPGPGAPGMAGGFGGRAMAVPGAPPAAGGFGGSGFAGGGFGAVSPTVPPQVVFHSASSLPHGDVAKKIETLERVILDTLAKYGERMTALDGDENIIVLVGGGGGLPGAIHVVQQGPGTRSAYSYSVRHERSGEDPFLKSEAVKQAEEKIRQLEEQLHGAQKSAAEAAKEKKSRARVSDQVRKAQDEVAKARENLMRAEIERTKMGALQARVEATPHGGPLYSMVHPDGGFQGGSSWVLKIKKSDVTSDAGELRKKAQIQKYAGGAGLVDEVVVENVTATP